MPQTMSTEYDTVWAALKNTTGIFRQGRKVHLRHDSIRIRTVCTVGRHAPVSILFTRRHRRFFGYAQEKPTFK